MDYEDHFTSHVFGNLYWPLFERYIDRDDLIQMVQRNVNEMAGTRLTVDDDVDEVTISVNVDGDVSRSLIKWLTTR